jgi:hypothetical protein
MGMSLRLGCRSRGTKADSTAILQYFGVEWTISGHNINTLQVQIISSLDTRQFFHFKYQFSLQPINQFFFRCAKNAEAVNPADSPTDCVSDQILPFTLL